MDYEAYFGNGNAYDRDTEMQYDEIDIVDFTYHPSLSTFTYPCPCGDLFIITLLDLKNGEIIARCPSCSLTVRVIYEQKDIMRYEETALAV